MTLRTGLDLRHSGGGNGGAGGGPANIRSAGGSANMTDAIKLTWPDGAARMLGLMTTVRNPGSKCLFGDSEASVD